MKCLICYKPLENLEIDCHQKCIIKTFDIKQLPQIEINELNLKDYAKKIIGSNTAITGVQPKLSLWLEKSKNNIRFTIVDTKSNYIIKPQSETYKSLPENEDLCMHLAEEFGIKTAKHSLIKLPSEKLAYITKRFDRIDENKLTCEDLCQLSETLTEHKYRGSYEKVGKTIKMYSSQSGLDALNYFQLVIFSFITGNSDMHLKNFSMLETTDKKFILSPAYDLVSTFLVIQNETEQLSLTLNGKKNRLKKSDFDEFAKSLTLTEKQKEYVYKSFSKKLENAIWWIENSFLSDEQKEKFQQIITYRSKYFE
jgi:serine/threonine-protein kinase HipA